MVIDGDGLELLGADFVVPGRAVEAAGQRQGVLGVAADVPVPPELHAGVGYLAGPGEVADVQLAAADLALDGDLEADDLAPGGGQADRAACAVPDGVLAANVADDLLVERVAGDGVELGDLGEGPDVGIAQPLGVSALGLEGIVWQLGDGQLRPGRAGGGGVGRDVARGIDGRDLHLQLRAGRQVEHGEALHLPGLGWEGNLPPRQRLVVDLHPPGERAGGDLQADRRRAKLRRGPVGRGRDLQGAGCGRRRLVLAGGDDLQVRPVARLAGEDAAVDADGRRAVHDQQPVGGPGQHRSDQVGVDLQLQPPGGRVRPPVEAERVAVAQDHVPGLRPGEAPVAALVGRLQEGRAAAVGIGGVAGGLALDPLLADG